jgi:hypothetical protein
VLLLASRGDRDLELVLLFDGVDGELLRWVLFEPTGPRVMRSPFSVYTKLSARPQGSPGVRELRIDRAWAIDAVRTMIAGAN